MDLNWTDSLRSELEIRESQHLRRRLSLMESGQGVQVRWEGRAYLNFCSNDYLGLATHPQLIAAAQEAARRYGAGAGASRLVCGNFRGQQELEEALAEWKGAEAALTFANGYATALGVIPALVGPGDTVILDKRSHACLVDGARLSRAALRVFPHNDLSYLEKLLQRTAGRGRTLIVTESIFSMDGDAAPLREIVQLKNSCGAWLLVDEAHAAGIFGPQRRGRVEELNLSEQVEVQMGTLGKALGASGGYIVGPRVLIDFLINHARTLIYSTAPPPAASGAALAGVRFVQSAEGQERCEKLWKNVRLLAELLDQPTGSAIFPVIYGAEEKALDAGAALRAAGFLAQAIRYPTVARGRARLRLTLTSDHEKAQIEKLAAVLPRPI